MSTRRLGEKDAKLLRASAATIAARSVTVAWEPDEAELLAFVIELGYDGMSTRQRRVLRSCHARLRVASDDASRRRADAELGRIERARL